MSDVLILDASPERLEEAAGKIFAAFPFSWTGKKVLLKPNMVGAYAAERGVTTHPGLVRSCRDWLREAGATVIVGDNPGVVGYGVSDAVATACGIKAAAGDSYVNISREAASVPLRSSLASSTLVSKAVLEADVFITLPRFKTHMQTLITGAIKNSYGTLAGGEKARFHRLAVDPKTFSRAVAEVFAIRPPDLAIMDGLTAMEGNGPSSDDLRPLSKIIASRDAVAVDALMAAMMGVDPQSVPMLAAAREMKLGETDLAGINCQGEWSPIEKFKLPRSFGRGGILAKMINRVWGRLFTRTVLQIAPGLCQRCGLCHRQCPVQAVKKIDGGFRIDNSRCIRCYCCYEICVHRAIRIGSPFDRLVRRIVRTREGI
jgi:uncharacterized protein (DUF362 family)/ferredoxin-like protein FixX